MSECPTVFSDDIVLSLRKYIQESEFHIKDEDGNPMTTSLGLLLPNLTVLPYGLASNADALNPRVGIRLPIRREDELHYGEVFVRRWSVYLEIDGAVKSSDGSIIINESLRTTWQILFGVQSILTSTSTIPLYRWDESGIVATIGYLSPGDPPRIQQTSDTEALCLVSITAYLDH